MKGIVKLHIDIQIIGTEAEIEEIINNPHTIVAEECFQKLNRRIIKATVGDYELTEEEIDVNKMLDSRGEGNIIEGSVKPNV